LEKNKIKFFFLRQYGVCTAFHPPNYAHMTPSHLAPKKGVDINAKISVLYIYTIIKKCVWSRRQDNT